MRVSLFRRRFRRYRAWWPVGLAVGGAGVLILVGAIRSSGDDRGLAGPLVTVCLIAALAGLATGVIAGLVQFSAPIELRVRLALVAFVLVMAGLLSSGSLAAGLAALTGSAVALGSRWSGRRIMSALLPHVSEDD